MPNPNILVIDDQWGVPGHPRIHDLYGALPFNFLLESSQSTNGNFIVEISIERIRRELPNLSVVLLDIMFGDEQDTLGIDILKHIRSEFTVLPIIMFTSLESETNRKLVEKCMELGANGYVQKAPSAEKMHQLLRVYTDPSLDFALYGISKPIREIRALITRIAFGGTASVLIVGESGTGKELIARALHSQSNRNKGPFVSKNCAHSDSQLLESELFGHEKGAFTGADAQRIGLLEEANEGVLFLDEIADMPLSLQAKLLTVIENRSFRRLGNNKEITSDFQLICATNQEPKKLVVEGKLREDLFNRINVMRLDAPPLRNRPEDIPVYVDLFIKKFKVAGGASYMGNNFSNDSMEKLKKYHWPGNVRELRNVVERAIILSQNNTMELDCLTPEIAGSYNISDQEIESRAHSETSLPKQPDLWLQTRLVSEIKLAISAKQKIQSYKKNQWKAEFMRLMYPSCRAQNAKGFSDLIRRLTKGPWGDPNWEEDDELKELINELKA